MPVIVGDIAIGHPRYSLVQQLLGLVAREVISKAELHTLHYVIEKEAGRFDDPDVRACTYPLDGGRQVRVHTYGQADRAQEMGETLIEKAAAAPGQVVHNRIGRLRKNTSALSESDAIVQVFRDDPALYESYVMACRKGEANPRPVTKAAPPTYEAVCQEAERLMAHEPGLTKRAALQRLALQHQGEPAYYEAYRRYHLSAGAFDGTTAGETRAPVDKTRTVYDRMWG